MKLTKEKMERADTVQIVHGVEDSYEYFNARASVTDYFFLEESRQLIHKDAVWDDLQDALGNGAWINLITEYHY